MHEKVANPTRETEILATPAVLIEKCQKMKLTDFDFIFPTSHHHFTTLHNPFSEPETDRKAAFRDVELFNVYIVFSSLSCSRCIIINQ